MNGIDLLKCGLSDILNRGALYEGKFGSEYSHYRSRCFLLTSDAFVWSKAKNHIHYVLIHFEAIRIHSVDLMGMPYFIWQKSFTTDFGKMRKSLTLNP